MDDYIYICLKISKKTGEIENMSRSVEHDQNVRKEIRDVYKKLNITSNNNHYGYMHYSGFSHYDYNERTSLDNSTYARI